MRPARFHPPRIWKVRIRMGVKKKKRGVGSLKKKKEVVLFALRIQKSVLRILRSCGLFGFAFGGFGDGVGDPFGIGIH